MVLAWSLQHKRGTALEWIGVDPLLKAGQIGFEFDGTNFSKCKVGNGVNLWSVLPYFVGNAINSVSGTLNRIIVDNTDPLNPIIDIDPAYTAALQAFAEALVTGLWDDRGNHDASTNNFPVSGGSGTGLSILKGDIWTVNVPGVLGAEDVESGDTVRALIDNPGQTASNWAIGENNIGYVPENSANKDLSGGYVGKTLEKINFWNAARTFMSFIVNAATGQRTYTFQDRDGTIADNTDLAGKQNSLGFTPEDSANKDATGGYAGLTLFKINFKNALNTFTSFFTNTNTAARTYTFQDRNGTIADDTDLALKANLSIVPVIVYKGVRQGSAVTGGTGETLSLAILIPGGTFASGDILRLFSKSFKVGTAGTYFIRWYLNSSASLSGATLITVGAVASGATLTSNPQMIEGGFTSGTTWERQSGQPSNTLDESSLATGVGPNTYAWNVANPMYMIMSIQLSNGADSVQNGHSYILKI